ncbi:MAG: hypothetical protein Q9174_005276 [Haloplaca sp. 1 TL-2023]
MASTEVAVGRSPLREEGFRPRKRFRVSELPINASQRSAIDGLLHTYKKKGEFDELRKKVWSQYLESDAKTKFNDRLIEFADAEIDRDPSFLSRERGKAVTLMQGALDRSDIYKSVEVSLDQFLSEHLENVLAAAREIRKAEIGEEAAKEEQRLGDIPDEEYEREATVRREARDRQRKQDEARRRREEEKEQLRLEAKQKEEELQRLRKLDERMKERQAREKRKEEERKRQAEENDERRKVYEKRRAEEAELRRPSVRPREQSRSGRNKPDGAVEASTHASRQNVQEAEKSTDPQQTIDPETDKELEETALDLLLRESRELMAKSSTKAKIERSGSLEPPHRKPHALKPRSSNISPSKMDRRQPARSDSVKPVLSFSSTNTNPRGAIPSQRLRSRSPASAHHSHSAARSPSQSHSHQEHYHNRTSAPQRRPFRDSADHKQRGDTGRYYEHSQEVNHHNHTLSRQDTREKDRGRSYSRDESYDTKQQSRYQQHDHGHRDRARERDKDYDDKYRRDRRDGHRDRSRSPLKASLNQSRDNMGNTAKAEMDIDRITERTDKDTKMERNNTETEVAEHTRKAGSDIAIGATIG